MSGKAIVLIMAVIMVVSCYGSPYRRPVTKKSCPCFKIYLPVCGSDGESYNNECEFNCQADHLLLTQNIRLQIIKEDHCDAPEYDPNDVL